MEVADPAVNATPVARCAGGSQCSSGRHQFDSRRGLVDRRKVNEVAPSRRFGRDGRPSTQRTSSPSRPQLSRVINADHGRCRRSGEIKNFGGRLSSHQSTVNVELVQSR